MYVLTKEQAQLYDSHNYWDKQKKNEAMPSTRSSSNDNLIVRQGFNVADMAFFTKG